MAGSGFVLVEVSRRRRGRPDHRRRVVVDLGDGTRVGFSSVPRYFVWGVRVALKSSLAPIR